jgi:DNA-binding NarL/FixJ family response regulator
MPHIGIIFVTMFQDEFIVFKGLQAGGRGYILKDSDPETMQGVSKHFLQCLLIRENGLKRARPSDGRALYVRPIS